MNGNNFQDDIEEIKKTLLEADVISLFFPYFGKTVLFDIRSNETDGPAVILTDMVRSPRERIRSMEKLRPGFDDPEKMVLIPWVRYLETLIDSGIWNLVVNKLEETSYVDPQTSTDEILVKLRNLEYIELANAIKGRSYKTLWSRHEQK
ncbi:MAG TPA: hypothetical protein DEP04_09105 [Dehalococcoidia bacterium]|nr:hypothetical protein [Chloroflexota bacterium]HCE76772.1 hypothetical protein [Dehalococcoidia bacterium]